MNRDTLYIIDYSRGYLVLVNYLTIPQDKGTYKLFLVLYSLVIVFEDSTVQEYDMQDLEAPDLSDVIATYHNYSRYTYYSFNSASIS